MSNQYTLIVPPGRLAFYSSMVVYTYDKKILHQWIDPIKNSLANGDGWKIVPYKNKQIPSTFPLSYFKSGGDLYPNSEEIRFIISAVTYVPQNVITYLSLLPENIKNAIKKVYVDGYGNVKELEKEFKVKIVTKEGRGYWSTIKLNPPFDLFLYQNGSDNVMSQDIDIRKNFIAEIYPYAATGKLTSVNPEPEDIRWMPTDVSMIMRQFNLAVSAGTIPVNASGIVTTGVAKKMSSAITVQNFPVLNKMPDYDYLRMQLMMIGFVTLAENSEDSFPSTVPSAQWVKKVVERLAGNIRCHLYAIFPYVKGMGGTGSDESYAKEIGNRVNQILSWNPGVEMDVRELIHVVDYNFANAKDPLSLFSANYFERGKMLMKGPLKNDEQRLGYLECVRILTPDFIGRYLLALASFGVLNVTFRSDITPDGRHTLDAIRSVSLTELGEYVFGLRPDAPADGVDEQFKDNFELSDSSLIIRLKNPQNPLNAFVRNLGTSIGTSMVAVSESTFIAKLTTPEELENRIDIFKREIVSGALPENWSAMLDGLQAKCNAIGTNKSASKYKLLSLAPESKELQQLVASNPEIRKHVILAEDYNILIEKDFLLDFKKILRQHGYVTSLPDK